MIMNIKNKMAVGIFAMIIFTFLFFRFISKEIPKEENEFNNLTLTLKDDIQLNNGKRAKDHYLYFHTNEYKAKFIIPSHVFFLSDRDLLENISKNDILKVLISKNEEALLDIENKKIPILGLTLNDKLIYSPDTYIVGQGKQTKRSIALYGTFLFAIFLYVNEKMSKRNKTILSILLFSLLTLLFLTKQI